MNMNQNIYNSSFISPPPRNIPYESSYYQNSRNNGLNGIHSQLSSVTNMFYPPSNAFIQPPTPVHHHVKRTASPCFNESTYDYVSKRSYVSTSISNDLRRFQNDTVQDSRHSDVTFTPDQFDAIRFTPVSGVTPKETVSDILNKPVTSTAIEEEAIGHLSFSDLSDSFLPEDSTPPPKQTQPSKKEFLQSSHNNHDLAIQFKKEGNRLYEQHDYTTAILNYSISLSYNPSDPVVFSNRAACFLSINKPRKALKDALRAIDLDPSFIRGYCRAGKCHLLQGHLPQAKELYDKSLSLLLQNQREGKEMDYSRLNECQNAIRVIKSVMKQNESLPLCYNSPQEVQSTIRILLSIKENCYGWRDLYLRLIHCYLLLQDVASAEIALSHITPSLLPSLNQVQHHLTPINYPFGIEGWDAEELDLFNQDVSGVDVEVIHLWYQFFIMKGDVEKVLLLRTMMKNEPRFRDYRTAQQLLSPFDFLENWNIRFIEGKTLYEEKRYKDCLNRCSSCMEDIQHFIQVYGNQDFSVSFHKSRRFSSWLNNVLFDTLLCDCSILTIRCLYHCENYQGVIEECGRVLSIHEDCAFAYKRRGQAYCILHLFDSGLADIRRYLSYMPKDNKMIKLYSHIQSRAKVKLPFSSPTRSRFYHGVRKADSSSFKPNQESFKSRFEASFQPPEQASEQSSNHMESESQKSWRSPLHSRFSYNNYYALLGVTKNASEKEIRQSYRRLALQYHPDKNPSQEAQNLFVKIKEAYDVLSDPDKRRKYDVSY